MCGYEVYCKLYLIELNYLKLFEDKKSIKSVMSYGKFMILIIF